MERWIDGRSIEVLIHGAAFTSPPKVDADPLRAIDVNIVGTANVVRLYGTRHPARLHLDGLRLPRRSWTVSRRG